MPDRYAPARAADTRRMYVTLTFPDSDARYAARITELTLASTPGPVDEHTQIMIEVTADGGPAEVAQPDEGPVCRFCGDYIHQPSDAFPDDRRWFDSTGGPACPMNAGADGLGVGPHEPAPAGETW